LNEYEPNLPVSLCHFTVDSYEYLINAYEYFDINPDGFSLNSSMHSRHIHDFRINSTGTISTSLAETTTSLHQHGFSLLIMQLFALLQKGHDF